MFTADVFRRYAPQNTAETGVSTQKEMLMWNQMQSTWQQAGLVEYGIYQRDRKTGAPAWRRHVAKGNARFKNLESALFAPNGARKACKGKAPYPKNHYAANEELFVPYVSTWLEQSESAYLIRASAGNPEITIIPVNLVVSIPAEEDSELTNRLAKIFGLGAEKYKVRLLGDGIIIKQKSKC